MKKLFFYFILFVVISSIGAMAYIHFTQETKTLDDKARKEIGGSFIKLSKGNVYYQLAGNDTGKTVILIHGAGHGCYAWDNNFVYLVNQGFRVLRYDFYGRGFSDRPDVAYDSTLLYQQLVEILDSLQLKPPYNVVSVSMGSSVALHYTERNQRNVTKLALVDPASLSDGKIAWHMKLPIISDWLMSLYWYPRAVEKQMREFYDPSKVEDYRAKSWRQMQYKGYKRAILSTWQNILTLNMTEAMNRIGKSNIDVLLLWGKNDPLVPPAMSEHYLKAMPQADLIVIDSAGHLSNYERPELFNPALYKFLRDEK